MNNFLSKLIIKNAETSKPSYTTTAFISGFLLISLKLIVSGLTIRGYKMSDVSVSDWSMGVAALSSMWIANKHVNNIQLNKVSQKIQDKE